MSEVVPLFTELAALPSPPGEERAVADRVAAYLRDLALDVDEDDAGERVGSNAGNLYTRVEPTAEGVPLFFCAHLDTVPPDGPLEPVLEDGIVRNAGGTILGADNKAAVAVMLEATRRVLSERRPHAGIELLFTPKEEVGLLGAAAFDAERLNARVGYVYDQAAPIGEVILGAPHAHAMQIRFHGRASHSGMYPEEGRSAIAAAARAIADFRLGRVDEESTANVGVISGGHRREHRPGVVHVPRRGALAGRGEAGRPRAGDAGGGDLRGGAGGVRGRDGDEEVVSRLPLQAGRPGDPARLGRAAPQRPRADVRACRAAPPTRTSSTSAGSSA